MADPEIPEVRAELQREDTPPRAPEPLGKLWWLFGAFVVIVAAIIILAYALT